MKIALVRGVTNNWKPVWVYMLIFPKGYQYGRTFRTLREAAEHVGLPEM